MKIIAQYRSPSLVQFLGLSTITLLLFIAQTLIVNAAPVNLISNPSLETMSSDPTLPQDWVKGGWGTNTRVFTYPTPGVNGNKAAKVEITSYTSGDAKWYFKEVPVTPGQTYTFSEFYMSNVPSLVGIRYTMANGTFAYLDIANGLVSNISNRWLKATGTFTVPPNVVSMTVFHVIKQVGYLMVDDFLLVSLNSPTPPTAISVSRSATVGANVSSIGSRAWTNPANITLSDDIRSRVILDTASSGEISNFLKASNFGFAIPTGSTITGIQASVEWQVDYSRVSLQIGPNQGYYSFLSTSASGAPIASAGKIIEGYGPPSPTDSILTYGEASDNWGVGWTPEQISDPTFSFLFSVINTNNPFFNVTQDAQVDNITVTVTYLPPTVTPPPPTPIPPSNLIPNPSFKTVTGNPPTPIQWQKGGWGSNNRTFTFPLAGTLPIPGNYGYDDQYAAKVEITSYTSGDAKWYFDNIPVTSGQTYTFSDWYQSNVPSYVSAQFKMANGTITYLDIGGQLPPSGTYFKNIQGTFTVPPNVVSMTVFHVIKQVGYLTTDYFSLVSASTTPPPPDTTPPMVSITTPGAEASVSGTTEVVISVFDNISIQNVTFLVDGNAVSAGCPPPVSSGSGTRCYSWNTAGMLNGPHILTARAIDTAGNIGTSTPITVTVANIAPPPPAPTNLIPNPSFEYPGVGGDPANWSRRAWGTNVSNFIYPGIGADGNKAAKIEITSFTNGDAKWRFNDIPVVGGRTYTFNNSYKSSVATELGAWYQTPAGKQYQVIAALPASLSWVPVTRQITVPTNASMLSVTQAIYRVGTLEVDDFSLTQNP